VPRIAGELQYTGVSFRLIYECHDVLFCPL